jgi:hypothetical protein
MDPTEVLVYLLAVCLVAVGVVSLLPLVYLCWLCWSRQEEERNTAAPLPVAGKELGYFPYSSAVAPGERQLECPICLEAFVHGAACGEVPACRHLFHQECIAPWMKCSSTCPVCRADIVPGSAPLSAAEGMV